MLFLSRPSLRKRPNPAGTLPLNGAKNVYEMAIADVDVRSEKVDNYTCSFL